MSGSIGSDGKTLRLQYKTVAPRGRIYKKDVERWQEIDQELVLRR